MFKISSKKLYKLASTAVVGGLLVWYYKKPFVPSGSPSDFQISKSVYFSNDKSNLDITLFQYQTCPFCCKVRTYLDFQGINYKIVEVNSVTKKQLKWSDYRKVPVALVKENNKEPVQLNDSSTIISILESYRLNQHTSIDQYQKFYPPFETTDNRGKIKVDYSNKYNIMYGDLKVSDKVVQSEIKWRSWVDNVFVHSLSPNIYRSLTESFDAFNYVSQIGEWEKHFSWLERQFIIYVGSFVMYFIGKSLKKRYNLKDDVRESLYDQSNLWIKSMGKKPFMGGELPNLSDLAMYGVLISIEGCSTFTELMNHNILLKSWFERTRSTLNLQRNVAIDVS